MKSNNRTNEVGQKTHTVMSNKKSEGIADVFPFLLQTPLIISEELHILNFETQLIQPELCVDLSVKYSEM